MPACPYCNIVVPGYICTNCGRNIAQVPAQTYPQQQVQPVAQQPVARPLPSKAVWALIFAIIAVIMIIIAGALAWWVMSIDMTAEVMGEEAHADMELEATLQEARYETTTKAGGETDTQDDEANLTDKEEEVGDLTGLLILLGMIMMILTIIVVGAMIGVSRTYEMARYTRTLKNVGLLLAALALIFILIAPIYYMVAWPNALEEDMEESIEDESADVQGIMNEIFDGSFMGDNSFDITEEYYGVDIEYRGDSSWGPGIGWYLAFICLIPIIITIVLIRSGGNQAARLAPIGPHVAQPQYVTQPQQPYSQPVQQYQPPPQQPPQYPRPPPSRPPAQPPPPRAY